MRVKQVSELDELIGKVRLGRMKRRTFLERATTLGLTSSMAVSVLAACGGSTNSSGGNGPAINIVWRSEDQPSGVYERLVNQYNQTNKDGIHVTLQNNHITSTQVLNIFLNMLSVRTADIDIMSMDIVWPAQFALNQWVVPLDDKWAASERQNYLPGPLQGCTFGGQLWAAPLRTDVGLLYYRTDLMKTPPQSWEELTFMAQQIQTKDATKYGYLWQGAETEALVCVFVEVLYGYGGTVLDPQNPKKVTINSPEAVQALTEMVNWISSPISPTALQYQAQGDVVNVWNQGEAPFMRNWPLSYSLASVPSSKVVGKFAIHSMPYGGFNTVGHSNIGGWQLGINAFSSTDKTDAAWQFVHYMLSSDSQRQIGLVSLLPTLKSTYQDSAVLQKVPFFKDLGPILQTALPRPVSPRYPDLTNALQARLWQALTKKSSPADALAALSNDLQLIVTL